MKSEQRRLWKVNLTLQIFSFALVATTALFLVIFYALWKIVAEVQYSLTWQIYLIILQISFTGFFLTLLIVMFVVLHRTLGPIPRMEKTLEEIIQGNYSRRITIRKKDIMYPFVVKLNKVFDLLEENKKQ